MSVANRFLRSKLHGDGGFMNNRLVADILMILVVLVVAYSAFMSQYAVNQARKTQDCSVQYLSKTIKALNERTQFAKDQAKSNADLQQAQKDFLTFILRQPPYPEAERSAAAQNYLTKLNLFVEISNKTVYAAEKNPYPTNRDFRICLR